MKLYEYHTLNELNQALAKFEHEGIPIKKVKLLTIGNAPVYYILVDKSGLYQPGKEDQNGRQEQS